MNAAILTAGCRLNQSESDALRARLREQGATVGRDPSTADQCFINTCTVTARADRSSVQLIRRACGLKPKPKVVVIGCLVQRSPSRAKLIPGVDEVWDNERKQAEISGACPAPERSRAFLKIQDGCDRGCGYCVVSRLRGRPTSLSLAEAVSRFDRLLRAGFQEIALTGLNLGIYRTEKPQIDTDVVKRQNANYKRQNLNTKTQRTLREEPQIDTDEVKRQSRNTLYARRMTPDAYVMPHALCIMRWADLAGLLCLLLGRPGRFRIRLGSIEPDTVNVRLLERFRDERINPHFHFPLQSGDDRILGGMGRRYSSSQFAELVRKVKEVRPDANIGADVIVGLPGENEDSFGRTRAFVARIGLGYLHVFPFSPRPGTRAYSMENQVPEQEKKRRVNSLRELSARLRKEYQQRYVGKVRPAVVESGETALTDNYLRVHLLKRDCSVEPRRLVDLLVGQKNGQLTGRAS